MSPRVETSLLTTTVMVFIRGELPLAFLLKKMSSIATAGPQGNVFLHNLYLSGDNSNPGPVTLRGNIISNDTSGSQIRIGGTITNNLWIQNPYAHNIGMPTAGVVTTIDNNVYTEAVAIGSAYG